MKYSVIAWQHICLGEKSCSRDEIHKIKCIQTNPSFQDLNDIYAASDVIINIYAHDTYMYFGIHDTLMTTPLNL